MTEATAVPESAGFVHQAAIYDRDEDLLGTLMPFLREGAAEGQPTLVAVGTRETRLLREALDGAPGITFLADEGYENPILALRNSRQFLVGHTQAGPARLVGQIPQHQLDTNWPGWLRYEAAVNHVLAALPVRTMCIYDQRRTPPPLLADVARAHPLLATAGGAPRAHDQFVDPAELLSDCLRGAPDGLEATVPAVDLVDPPVAAARAAVAAVAGQTRLPAADVDGLILAVSEVVTNAHRYGSPPISVRAWAAADRVVVTCTDAGTGPSNPFTGLVLPTGYTRPGGYGLWIAHQMCDRVDRWRHRDGFTVRLTAAALR